MAEDVGEVSGDTFYFKNDKFNSDEIFELYSANHATHNVPGFNVRYDELDESDGNRWENQFWFNDTPKTTCTCGRCNPPTDYEVSMTLDHTVYRLEAPSDGYIADFNEFEPDSNDISNENEFSDEVDVQFSFVLGYGPASLSATPTSNDYVDPESYDYVEWSLSQYKEALPTDQDNAKGVKTDVVPNVSSNSEVSIDTTNEVTVRMDCNTSTPYYNTFTIDHSGTVDVV